ncbi:MAG: hypothetical protein GX577_02165 [Leptolinea sp.]|nr:hypothetical protein [Leptolinea sp.]
MTMLSHFPNRLKRIFSILVILILISLAVIVRVFLFPYSNHDMTDAVIPWYDYLIKGGGLQAINGLHDKANGFPPYIYSPPYLYLLTLAIPLTKWMTTLETIKLVSVVFDFLSAWSVFLLVRLRYPSGWKKWAAFFVVCFAPTVVINSAYWGQFDGIYTAFLAVSLYFVCIKKYSLSLVFFATALAFKIQALLFAPLFVVLLFQRKIVWWKFGIVPIIFFFWMIPAYLAGYPLLAPFTTYLGGATQFQSLTMNTPNLYTFLPNQFYGLIVPLGTFTAVLVTLALLWIVIQREKEFTSERIILFILMISVVLPFILPKMHERYFYPAALFAIIFIFYSPQTRLIALSLQVTSLISYTPFLIGDELIPLSVAACYNGIIVMVVCAMFCCEKYCAKTSFNLSVFLKKMS